MHVQTSLSSGCHGNQALWEEEEKLEEAPVLEPVVVFPLCVMFHELVGILELFSVFIAREPWPRPYC